MQAYQRALSGESARPAEPIGQKAPEYSLARLAQLYFASPEYLGLKERTRHVYRLVIERFLKEHGHRDARQMKREHVKQIIGAKAATPGAANDLLKKLRALMRFAIDLDWRTDDPTTRVKMFEEGEFHTWTEEELAKFEERWPLGTPERTAYALHLYTGQRRSDICTMRWPRDDGLITVKQAKTGAELVIPVHPELALALAAWPRRHDVVLVNAFGRPFTANGYGNWFRDAIKAASLPDECSSHGLRKAAARRLAEAGCTEKQIAAITGHTTLKEVARYTKAANQAKLARAALNLQLQAANEAIPNPVGRAPNPASAVA